MKAILRYIPKVGKQLGSLVNHLEPLFQKMKQFGEPGESASESNRGIDSLKSIKDCNYSIYENDITTKLIRELLKKTIQNDDDVKVEKQNVLVINNLDRIDSEHIFRIIHRLQRRCIQY